MKKGLLALMVVSLLVVGMVAYSAAPKMWGIPDIVIGDAEDVAYSDYFFVFTDAFAFDDYFYWSTDGAKSLAWRYVDALPPDLIEINRLMPSAVANIASGFSTASFRNVVLSPHGGPYTLDGDGYLGTTDAAIVTLRVDNFLVTDDQDVAVFTEHGANDALINEYFRTDWLDVVMTSNPNWTWVPVTAGVAPGRPYGITPPNSAYNAADGALTMTSTGADNNFGYWYMPTDIPWIKGQSYIIACEVYGIPTGLDEQQTPSWRQYIPGMRLRVNARNETVASSLTILSEGSGNAGLTSDPANAGVETFIMDPRDHSNMIMGLQSLYFSFDMMEFSANNREYFGEKDDEGILGLKSINVSTFPTKMLWREAVRLKRWPTGETFADTFAADFSTVENGFGGTPPTVSTNVAGNILLKSQNVGAGFAIAQLNQTAGLLMNDDADFYALRFYLTSNNLNANWVRLRVMDSEGQRNADMNMFDYFGGYQLPGPLGSEYNVYLSAKRPVYDNRHLIFAFDLIDFNESGGNTEVVLRSVEAFGGYYPVVAP